ncbi:MAG: hypothetical protein L0K82_06485 [Pisciglobus halotolerans]|nr:hypothetical protein [Pisciglobus halotolerans]
MGIQDIKSNVKAIQNSRLIPFARKQTLLLNQLQTIDLLFLENSELNSQQDRDEAQLISDEIQFYLTSFLAQDIS